MLSKGLGVDENLSYREVSIEILEHQVKCLRKKEVATVRVYRGTTLLREQHGRMRPKRDPSTLICSVLKVRFTLPKSCFCLRNSKI